jgi:3-oxoacyl-[acyl-carrier protein] reductase
MGAVTANGWTGRGHICDVRDLSRIQEVVDETVRDFGRIDILVNNAGVAGGAYVDELSEELWDANFDINLKGTFLMCKAVVPVMKKQKSGRILNAASFAAIVPSLGSSAYAASKAGVHYFTRVLAGEVGPYDVTVNCYAPGMVPSEINHFTEQPADIQERLLDTLTLRRWQEAKDVASLLCFLASDHAGYITGTLVDVSGGKLATQIPHRAYQRAGLLD